MRMRTVRSGFVFKKPCTIRVRLWASFLKLSVVTKNLRSFSCILVYLFNFIGSYFLFWKSFSRQSQHRLGNGFGFNHFVFLWNQKSETLHKNGCHFFTKTVFFTIANN